MTADLTLFAWFLVACAAPSLLVLLVAVLRFRRSRSENRRLYGWACTAAFASSAFGLICAVAFAAGGSVITLFWISAALAGLALALANQFFWLIVRAICNNRPGRPIYPDERHTAPTAPPREQRSLTPTFVSIRARGTSGTAVTD